MRLEQADQLLAGWHRLTTQDAALAMVGHAADNATWARQRSAATPVRPVKLLDGSQQRRPRRMGGDDQLAVEPATVVVATAVLDLGGAALGHAPAVVPAHRRHPGKAAAWRSSRDITRTASYNSALSLGSCSSAAVTVLSIRTIAPSSSLSCLAWQPTPD